MSPLKSRSAAPVAGTLLALLCILRVPVAGESPAFLTLIREGDSDDSRGRSRDALAAFVEADKLEPDRADVLLRIAKQYSDLITTTRDRNQARHYAQETLRYAKRAVELAPDNAKAHLSLAIAYGRMTDFAENRTRLEYSKLIKAEVLRSIALDPTDDFAWHVLGRWHYGIATLNPLLRALAKVVYGGLPEASVEEAVKHLRKAADMAPQRMIHHSELAKAYAAAGRKDLARAEWQAVLTIEAEDGEDEQLHRTARAALKK